MAESRPQYDKTGQLIGILVKSKAAVWHLLLEKGFLLVKVQETGRLRIWDSEQFTLVDFADDK